MLLGQSFQLNKQTNKNWPCSFQDRPYGMVTKRKEIFGKPWSLLLKACIHLQLTISG